ncbi:MAG TPA: restriction endonuclease subunit S [Micromonosporaceae bacterium]
MDELGNVTVPDDEVTFASAPSRARRIARPGSVIVSTVRTYLRAVASVPHSKSPLVFSTGFAVLEASQDVDPRYLAYYCRCTPFIDEIVARSVGISYPAINSAEIGNISILLPPPADQQRIARFLDAETNRIDALRMRLAKMRELLALRRERIVQTSLGLEDGFPVARTPLKYLAAEITVGIVITPAKWYVSEGGTPALRGVNVKPGNVTTNDIVHISDEGHAENQKSRLREGDVVVVRTGQAGAAAVVPREFDGANCIDLILIRPGDKLSPRYVEYVLNSEYAREHVSQHSVGSIQAHFNIGAMKQIPFPTLTRSEQDRVVQGLDEKVGDLDKLSDLLRAQETLLAERRQALITAAVTGQIDVSTASGRGIED